MVVLAACKPPQLIATGLEEAARRAVTYQVLPRVSNMPSIYEQKSFSPEKRRQADSASRVLELAEVNGGLKTGPEPASSNSSLGGPV